MLKAHYLHHATVAVTDLDRARDFYGRILGLKEVPRRGVKGSDGAWFQVGPSQINLIRRDKREPDSPRHFGICVDSIRAARKALQEEGIEMTETTQVGNINRFFFADPDGNRLEIVCPIGQG